MGIHERKKREKEKRRQVIMSAAGKILSEKGFEKSTMEDIANEAELSPGTLYLYFKSKNDLFASLTIRVLQYLNKKLEDIINNNTLDTEQKIASLKDVMYDAFSFDPVIIIHMFNFQSGHTLNNFSPDIISEILTLSTRSQKIMTTIFQEGIDSELIGDKKPEALAELVWILFSGVVLREESKRIINGKEEINLKPSLENAFNIFLQGIKK
jgi:AcrR family transcriptional regulator